MLFIESVLFTRKLFDYFNDEEYAELQDFLIERPDHGDLIIGTGGLRKLHTLCQKWNGWFVGRWA